MTQPPSGQPATTGTPPGPLFTRIDHVGIACHDLDETAAFYEVAFGLRVTHRETNDEQGVHEAMLRVSSGATGTTSVQLLQPTRDDSPIAKHLARKGEGIHHVAYGVDDVAAALAELKARGVQLVDEVPRHGTEHSSIAFLHPKGSHGVLIELVQAAAPGAS